MRWQSQLLQRPGVSPTSSTACRALDADAFEVELIRCVAPVRELAAEAAALAAVSELRGRTLRLCITIVGALGPRCDVGDPACVPQRIGVPGDSLAAWNARPPGAPRCPARATPDHSRGSCAHDGECTVSGCGNLCLHWSFTPVGGVCPGIDGRWCGCVSGRCAWFL